MTDHPITFGAVVRREHPGGSHVDVGLWAGRDVGSRGYCGEVVMAPDEAEEFTRMLAQHQVRATTRGGAA